MPLRASAETGRTVAVTYRHARITDIQAVSDVYWSSILDVYHRHGFDDIRRSYPVNPFYGFCLAEEPEGFFVAEDAGNIIGAAFSWVRGHLWFLSHLFILPPYQGSGIGRTMLELTLQHGITAGSTVRAVITMAFNPVSIALYMKAGMNPVENIYLMRSTGTHRTLSGTDTAIERQDVHQWRHEDIDALDMEVFGISRHLHHRYLLGREDVSCSLFRVGGRAVAYAYHGGDGRIGPVLAVNDAPYEAIVETVMGMAHKESCTVSLMVPGSNTSALRLALARGCSIVMPYVLLSSSPFGDWGHYLFHSPGMM